MSDPWEEPTTKKWVEQVIEGMVPKMESSALVLSLVPNDRKGDVKFWVELGASICMDKPIIAIVIGDRPLPPKLELIADEVVYLEEGVNVQASEELAAAIKRVVE